MILANIFFIGRIRITILGWNNVFNNIVFKIYINKINGKKSLKNFNSILIV